MVDDKKRDLVVASMIAHALAQRNITCHLEPLEAYRAVLAAYRPQMIVFNHLTASHLVKYSKRLAEMGVLTAVLLNEGLCYDDEERLYNAGKHHTTAHIDMFFSWNQPMKDSLIQLGFGNSTKIEVTGPPRFDTYFTPWSKLFPVEPRAQNSRPRVLVCTNFGLTKFHDLPKEQVDQFFSPWSSRLETYRDYWGLVNSHYNSSRRIFDYLNALVQSHRFHLTIRPHPRENLKLYHAWMKNLNEKDRAWVRLDNTSNITQAMFDCDVHISCENCTTAMEAWIAGKPTVELVFDRHPVLYAPFFAELQPLCDDPVLLPEIVEAQLKNPEQTSYRAGRKKHLARWCNAPEGKSIQKIADLIAEALRNQKSPDWSQLNWNDFRRAWKLKLFKMLGLAYHFDPLLPLKKILAPHKYAMKFGVYQKAIKPSHVRYMQKELEKIS